MKEITNRIVLTLAGTAVMLLVLGCDVEYREVPMPPEGTYTAESFVTYFNEQKAENEYRVNDWALYHEPFRLRLPNIRVGDNTLTYKTEGKFTQQLQTLLVECAFTDTRPVRKISNGDTVDIEGRTVKAERSWSGLWRIELKMENCRVDKVDAGF